LYFFGEKNEFIALIMQTPIQNNDSFNFDDFITLSERVKQSTQATADRLEKHINHKIDFKVAGLEKQNITLENKLGTIEK